MSEYIEIDAEWDAENQIILFLTNLPLSDAVEGESYDSPAELVEGSPVAQLMAGLDGIVAVRIDMDEISLTLDESADWHTVVADVTAALKDFFL